MAIVKCFRSTVDIVTRILHLAFSAIQDSYTKMLNLVTQPLSSAQFPTILAMPFDVAQEMNRRWVAT
jgi:hypothetical protein